MGNPLTSEVAAFRWLIVVLVGAASVGLVSKLISPVVAIFYGLVLIGIVCVIIIRGMSYLLGSPDDDEPEPETPAPGEDES